MRKTVFVTGSSSGIGRETVKFFQKKGWNVVATMRHPEKETELQKMENVSVLRLDVTEEESIELAVKQAISLYGKIDVLVNNAGYYVIGVLESLTKEQIKRQLDTNLLGMILVTKAVLPYMREQHAGKIINLSSVAGRTTVPITSIYHASKYGVEGFTESLQFELKPLGIEVALIEPGVIQTDFYGRSMLAVQTELKEYKSFVQRVTDNLVRNGRNGSSPTEVAEKIYSVAANKGTKLRHPVGKSTYILCLRRWLPQKLYACILQREMLKG